MGTARHIYETMVSSTETATLMDSIREHEGYRGMPYEDSLGKPTIGVGCLLPLSEDESMLVAFCRMSDGTGEMEHRLQAERGINVLRLPKSVKEVLIEMAFQMGVPKLMGFKKMLAAIAVRDWSTAAEEALDSKWAKQTPVRSHHAAGIFRKQASVSPSQPR